MASVRAPRVVIVGAGASGLSAANALLPVLRSLSSLTVLEAQTRVGGRVCSVFMGGKSYESGAQWLHGQTDNSAFDLATEHGICNPPEYRGIDGLLPIICTNEGNALNEDICEHLMDMFEKGNETLAEFENVPANSSLGEKLRPFYKDNLKAGNEKEKVAFMDLLHRMNCCTEASDDWDQVSFKSAITDFYMEPDDNFYITFKDDHKFGDLIDILLRPVEKHVRLGAVVRLIEMVEKDYKANSKEVEITLNNGEVIRADVVLVTVSLGVLKKDARSMFKPQLSEQKLKAIDEFGFGVVDKIFLLFDDAFWPEDRESFLFVHYEEPLNFTDIEENDDLDWTRGIFCAERVEHRPKALCVWVHGIFARKMEKLSNEQVLEDVHAFLQKMTKNVIQKVPKPIDINVSRWGSNPFARGSWSFGTVAASASGITSADLARPEFDGLIRFAGEATAGKNFSTVPGAMDSGRREAQAIIEQFNLSKM